MATYSLIYNRSILFRWVQCYSIRSVISRFRSVTVGIASSEATEIPYQITLFYSVSYK